MGVEACILAAGVPSFWQFLLRDGQLFDQRQDCPGTAPGKKVRASRRRLTPKSLRLLCHVMVAVRTMHMLVISGVRCAVSVGQATHLVSPSKVSMSWSQEHTPREEVVFGFATEDCFGMSRIGRAWNARAVVLYTVMQVQSDSACFAASVKALSADAFVVHRWSFDVARTI